MNYFDLYTSYPDRTIAAAWDSEVKDRVATPFMVREPHHEQDSFVVNANPFALSSTSKGSDRTATHSLKEADKAPWLANALTECGDELFARFAACYAELRALPRGARRALQRQIARSSELAAILPEYLQGGRGLQRRLAWSLAGAALLLALGQGVSNAATITVTTNNPYVISDGQCSLIEAIVNANNDAATYPDCPAGSGADTIVLPPNANLTLSAVYATTQDGNPVGLPLITSQITIEGNGAIISRPEGAPDFGLMDVEYPSGNLTLENMTLSGGVAAGGGAVSNSGALTIKNSTISGNTAGFGGGVSNSGALTIKNSTISGNTASFAGGGIYSSYSDIIIENSTISGNTATQDGGGVRSRWGFSLTIINSTISGNRSDYGGGVSETHLVSFTLANSLIAGNQARVAPEIATYTTPCCVVGAGVESANNLFGTNGNGGVSGFSPGPTDIVPSVPLAQILGPLKNNGGPTQTHALVAGSPAIDAGDPNGCRDNSGALLQTDQRGFPRNVDGNGDGTARCDIGAVEFGAGSATLMDFDGDGRSDIGVYRNGAWFILRSSDGGVTATGWGGLSQDRPVPADYDGDGKMDIAVYRDGTWFILRSSDGGQTTVGWGGLPQDLSVPADYDGDGKADIAVYRDGTWFIIRSSDGGQTIVGWGGLPQDVPVPADFDGDGKADIAVYRDGTWFIIRSSDGDQTTVGWGGVLTDVPIPADYDGDGKADIAVYRDGAWFILRSSDGSQTTVSWGGLPQDVPVPADFDGDGKADMAVYRDGTWFIIRSSDGMQTSVAWGGAPEDIPLN